MSGLAASAYNVECIGENNAEVVAGEHNPSNAALDILVPWDAIPGEHIRVGMAGQFGASPAALDAIVRIRAGGFVDLVEVWGGALGVQFTVPADGVFHDYGKIGDLLAKPSGYSRLVFTQEPATSPTHLDMRDVVVSIYAPDGLGKAGLLLSCSNGAPQGAVSDEHVVFEWLVDFDQFEPGDLIFGFATQPGDGGRHRVRVGGTVGQFGTAEIADGELVVDHAIVGSGFMAPDGHVRHEGEVVTHVGGFTGVLPVKISIMTASIMRASIVIREA